MIYNLTCVYRVLYRVFFIVVFRCSVIWLLLEKSDQTTPTAMESRVYDSVYDPVYTTHASLNRSRGKPLYRATPGAVSGKERANFFRRPIVPFLHVRRRLLFYYLFYI